MTRPFTIDLSWGPVLEGLGLGPRDVLRQAQLPGGLFEETRPTLPPEAFFRLFDVLARSVGGVAPGLKLGQLVGPEAFSPPLFAAYCSPDARTAMARLAAYKPLIGPLEMDVSMGSGGLEVCLRPHEGVVLPTEFVLTELVFLFSLVARATRTPIRARQVELTALPRSEAALEMYRAFFQCDLTQGAANTIVFRAVDAERPFLSANPGLFAAFEPALRARLDDLTREAALRDRVRAALVEAIPAGQAELGAVAARLGMSRRTLQRRLRADDLTFKDELRHVREELARDYLTRTTYTSAEISFLLGYEDPNSFIRAFQGWTGTTPEALRGAA